MVAPVNRYSATATKYNSEAMRASAFEGRQATVRDQIVYEQPLNERIRTFLRLEFLFEQCRAFSFRDSVWDSRAAMNALFDLSNAFSRTDIKTELIKELERQSSFLEKLAENPRVDRTRLDQLLSEMDVLSDRLHALPVQSLEIRSNEFLQSVKQRSAIAGGCCDFDLPAYHFWLSQSSDRRITDMSNWLEPFEPIRESVNVLLRLIRESGQNSDEFAENGFFQKNLDQSSVCQLIRVTVASDYPYFAEVSGGKHRFTVRFMRHGGADRPSQAEENIPFKLTCCML